MKPWRLIRIASVVLALTASRSGAASGPYTGIDMGVAEATNDNYRSHVETGGSAAPFVGVMFNDYVGLQAQLPVFFQPPDDNDDRPQANLSHPHQWTTAMGLTLGPRLSLPLNDALQLYVLGQGGGFKGMGARLNQWAPGFNLGGGLDYSLTRQLSVGLFARWNRLYMAPHPTFLVGHVDNDQGAKDAQFLTAGLSLKFAYGPQQEVATLPAPTPPPTPRAAAAPAAVAPSPAVAAAMPPPVKKKIILRSVHFDFAKAKLRADAEPVLAETVQTLKQAGGQAVIVEGHTDSKGSGVHNLVLARCRAENVYGYLVAHGIEPSRIRSVAIGAAQPVASNETEDGRAQNRRVELRLE